MRFCTAFVKGMTWKFDKEGCLICMNRNALLQHGPYTFCWGKGRHDRSGADVRYRCGSIRQHGNAHGSHPAVHCIALIGRLDSEQHRTSRQSTSAARCRTHRLNTLGQILSKNERHGHTTGPWRYRKGPLFCGYRGKHRDSHPAIRGQGPNKQEGLLQPILSLQLLHLLHFLQVHFLSFLRLVIKFLKLLEFFLRIGRYLIMCIKRHHLPGEKLICEYVCRNLRCTLLLSTVEYVETQLPQDR